jgi:hypothetical protein
MKKRILGLLLAVVMLTGFVPCSYAAEIAEEGTCGENAVYKLYDDGTLIISGEGEISSRFSWSDEISSVVIEEGITGIGRRAFFVCSSIQSVIMPNSLVTIGEEAFDSCEGLTEISIPDGVRNIEREAFSYCKNLAQINMPDSVRSIEQGAFEVTEYCMNQDNWENGVLYCGNSILDSDSSLRGEYSIRDSVVCIADAAFKRCSHLTSIKIPKGITAIGQAVFSECSSLESVEIPDTVESIGDSAFFDCRSLAEITIPYSVKTIEAGAFSLCESLSKIHIPYGVASIGEQAFGYCSNLAEIDIPKSVTELGRWVFDGTAYYYNRDNWENGLLYTGEHLVAADRDISGSVVIKDGTLNIADYAMNDCYDITSITLPQSLRTIGNRSIVSSNKLKSIFVPPNVTRIGERALPNSLADITVSEDNKEYSSVNGNLYNKAKTVLIKYAGGKTDKIFELPDSVTEIDEYGLINCYKLTGVSVSENNTAFSSQDGVLFNKDKSELVLYPARKPDRHYTVPLITESIRAYAFYDCRELRTLIVSESVNNIGTCAFYGADGLNAIFIPSATIWDMNIGTRAFPNDEDNIVEVYFGGDSDDWDDLVYTYRENDLCGISVHYNMNGIPTPIIGEFNAPADNGDGTYKITVPVENIPYDCTAIAVFYADGAVSEVKQMAVTLSDTSVEFSAQNSTDSAKVFIWDELNGMYPLCESKASKTV